MPKVSGILPKIVERRVSDAQGMLWNAVPRHPGENLKAWYGRAARDLGWTARRVRAWWNGEARRIDHHEIVTLNQRIARAKAAEKAAWKHHNEIKKSLGASVARSPLDERVAHGPRREVAPDRGVVPRSDR